MPGPSAPPLPGRRSGPRRPSRILVVEAVEETRDGIVALLAADGHRVEPARDEEEAVQRARRSRPDLILVSLAGPPAHVLAGAVRIRRRARLEAAVPVVVFGLSLLDEGAEAALGDGLYGTRPDDFDQLRAFLRRLLVAVPRAAPTEGRAARARP